MTCTVRSCIKNRANFELKHFSWFQTVRASLSTSRFFHLNKQKHFQVTSYLMYLSHFLRFLTHFSVKISRVAFFRLNSVVTVLVSNRHNGGLSNLS